MNQNNMRKNFILLFALLPLMAMAEVLEATIDGIRYRVDTEKRIATVIHSDYNDSITIPAFFGFARMQMKVTRVDAKAFADCPKLTDIFCFASTVPYFDGEIIDETALSNITVHVPALAVEYYRRTTGWRSFKAISPMTDYDGDPSEIGTVANEKPTPKKIDIKLKNPVTGK